MCIKFLDIRVGVDPTTTRFTSNEFLNKRGYSRMTCYQGRPW